jgi:ribonuclease HI
MKKVEIHTDGSCLGNPGPGGYAAILVCNGREKVISGGCKNTTNSRMELTAVVEGLSALTEPCEVIVYSDSKYVVDAVCQRWLFVWQDRNWIKPDRKRVLNVDLWQKLTPLLSKHQVKFEWTKGHAGNKYNERCDGIATSEAQKYKDEIKNSVIVPENPIDEFDGIF